MGSAVELTCADRQWAARGAIRAVGDMLDACKYYRKQLIESTATYLLSTPPEFPAISITFTVWRVGTFIVDQRVDIHEPLIEAFLAISSL